MAQVKIINNGSDLFYEVQGVVYCKRMMNVIKNKGHWSNSQKLLSQYPSGMYEMDLMELGFDDCDFVYQNPNFPLLPLEVTFQFTDFLGFCDGFLTSWQSLYLSEQLDSTWNQEGKVFKVVNFGDKINVKILFYAVEVFNFDLPYDDFNDLSCNVKLVVWDYEYIEECRKKFVADKNTVGLEDYSVVTQIEKD